jgi:hypothetical protein
MLSCVKRLLLTFGRCIYFVLILSQVPNSAIKACTNFTDLSGKDFINPNKNSVICRVTENGRVVTIGSENGRIVTIANDIWKSKQHAVQMIPIFKENLYLLKSSIKVLISFAWLDFTLYVFHIGFSWTIFLCGLT